MQKPKRKSKKMGRPEIPIDIEQLGALCRMKPSKSDCAAFFKCHEASIDRIIKKKTGLTFAAFRQENLVHTRFDLIRKAIRKSDQSDTMHIFCLKNLCDWTDKLKTENEHTGTLFEDQDDETLEQRIKILEEKRLKSKNQIE